MGSSFLFAKIASHIIGKVYKYERRFIMFEILVLAVGAVLTAGIGMGVIFG